MQVTGLAWPCGSACSWLAFPTVPCLHLKLLFFPALDVHLPDVVDEEVRPISSGGQAATVRPAEAKTEAASRYVRLALVLVSGCILGRMAFIFFGSVSTCHRESRELEDSSRSARRHSSNSLALCTGGGECMGLLAKCFLPLFLRLCRGFSMRVRAHTPGVSEGVEEEVSAACAEEVPPGTPQVTFYRRPCAALPIASEWRGGRGCQCAGGRTTCRRSGSGSCPSPRQAQETCRCSRCKPEFGYGYPTCRLA